jgi:hypothetical protein
MTTRFLLVALVLSAMVLAVSAAEAQSIGTFRWQLQPHCNVVTVAITQTGGVYRLEGTDDQCGAGAGQASVIGTAFQNPDGTIGLGLNIVASPGGTPSPVHATITLGTLSGTWRDSAGQTGSFAFTPGAGTGGSPRSSGGTIGAAAIDSSQVQVRVSGSCAAGLFMQSIGQGGAVGCAAASSGAGITGMTAGAGLVGGGTAGNVALALRTTASGAFDFANVNGVVMAGTYGTGSFAVSGAGTRLLWYPRKAAFRAGRTDGDEWDDASIGNYSTATGLSTMATGEYSTALGSSTTASGAASTATGSVTTASGVYSTAMGAGTTASAFYSTAMGFNTRASGTASTAMGEFTTASGYASTALGGYAIAAGTASMAIGNAHARFNGSFVWGDYASLTRQIDYEPNQFVVRATRGVGFYTNVANTLGVELPASGGGWLVVSDRNAKEAFRDLDLDDVLARIAGLPMQEWQYRDQPGAVRHIGPVAQDFHEAFGLGESTLRINMIDADGVALAGVKALEARTRGLALENAQLRARLARLEALLEKR